MVIALGTAVVASVCGVVTEVSSVAIVLLCSSAVVVVVVVVGSAVEIANGTEELRVGCDG